MAQTEQQEWLEKARTSESVARYLLAGRFIADAAFHAHQAIEKALKAILISKTGGLTKTHELVFLGRKAGLPENLIRDCEKLTALFLTARYPDAGRDVGKDDAEKAITIASEVIAWAEQQI